MRDMHIWVGDEGYVPDLGTIDVVATRIARVRGDAEFALWAVQHGADWPAVWSKCTRPDWVVEAVLLTECREHGCLNHRRLVGWLVEETRTALLTVATEVARRDEAHAALDKAQGWVECKYGPFAAFPLIKRASAAAVFYDPRAHREHERGLALEAAALRTLATVLEPASPVTAVRALARALGGELEHEELARRFSERFECPMALRCPLPD